MNRAPPPLVKDTLGATLLTWSVFAGSFGVLLIALASVLAAG
jgi:hypothetical protein